MTSTHPLALSILLATSCALGGVSGADGVDGDVVDGDVVDGDVVDGMGLSDGSDTLDPADGPAAYLLIDGAVHTGTDWNGDPCVGVWGEPMSFDMTDFPVTWAIAAVHASMLYRQSEIDYSPNAVLAVAIKESRLQCALDSFPNDDGCFQIEDGTAYTELQRIFPERFTSSHAAAVGGAHFESSALATVYYALFSMAMFRLYADDPQDFFDQHPDPLAQQKVLSAAYNRGLWWNGLSVIFESCATSDVTECFVDNAIAIDHANAIADYTTGLDGAVAFDAPLSRTDLHDYWQRIAPLYSDVADDAALTAIDEAFDRLSSDGETISFHHQLPTLLAALTALLPELATREDATAAACGLGYLYGDICG